MLSRLSDGWFGEAVKLSRALAIVIILVVFGVGFFGGWFGHKQYVEYKLKQAFVDIMKDMNKELSE